MRQGNTSWVGPGSAIARPESHLGIPPCSEGTMHEETLQRSGHDTQRANASQDFLLRSASKLRGHQTSCRHLRTPRRCRWSCSRRLKGRNQTGRVQPPRPDPHHMVPWGQRRALRPPPRPWQRTDIENPASGTWSYKSSSGAAGSKSKGCPSVTTTTNPDWPGL